MTGRVIAAAVTGLGGALVAHQTGYLTPEGFGLILSLELVLMVTIIGILEQYNLILRMPEKP